MCVSKVQHLTRWKTGFNQSRPVFFSLSIFQQTLQLATEKFLNLCNCNQWSGLLQLGSVRIQSFFWSSRLDLQTLLMGVFHHIAFSSIGLWGLHEGSYCSWQVSTYLEQVRSIQGPDINQRMHSNTKGGRWVERGKMMGCIVKGEIFLKWTSHDWWQLPKWQHSLLSSLHYMPRIIIVCIDVKLLSPKNIWLQNIVL